jgi:4-amino-4-deoxy-L-arabinose transferase-like glycosyltransferase
VLPWAAYVRKFTDDFDQVRAEWRRATMLQGDTVRTRRDPIGSWRRGIPPIAVGASVAVILAVLHVLWLARFRWGYITDWDEAGYISQALHDVEGLTRGPIQFVDAVGHSFGPYPPVVPVSAVPLLLLFGRSADVAQLTIPIYSVLLVLATYGVARHLMAARWAALAALCLGTAPVVSDYSRLFHFAVPAAALLTAALWALLNSAGLRRTGWVATAGVLLALMLTARTMTVSYLPGVALGTVVPILVQREDRRLRIRNLVVLWAVALAIAALWWVPAWDHVTGYLTSTGYGSEAAGYGVQHSVLSVDFWTVELQAVANYLYLPLLLTILVCFVTAAAFAVIKAGKGEPWRSNVRRWLTSDAFLLVTVVVGGYFALTSTSNQGTAFALPWLPALVVLGVAAATTVPARSLRVGLAVLLVAVCALNTAMKNGVSTRLSTPISTEVPLIGTVTVLDGRDLLYAASDGLGYPVRPPPSRLPAMHKRWSTLNDRLMRFMTSYAEERTREPVIVVGTGDYFINETRLALASELIFQRRPDLGLIRGPATGESYRSQLADYNFLITSEPPRAQSSVPANPFVLADSALRVGFRPVETLHAPDGRRVAVWWRDDAPTT